MMQSVETYDVVVVGSGAAGALAALCAAAEGMSVIILEKALKYGGTSATSGGLLWVPNHQVVKNDDSRVAALEYLGGLLRDDVQPDRLEALIDKGPEMVQFLKSVGVNLVPMAPYPDYFPDAPGARADRSLMCETFDGRTLGDNFLLMREQYSRYKLFNRYALDVAEMFALATKAKGWVFTFLKVIARYWSDVGTRKLGRRDRRFTMGNSLMGHLFKRVFELGVEVRMGAGLGDLILDGDIVSGVQVDSFGRKYELKARHGVILCAGGFEWNQELRDRFFKVPGDVRYSSTPEGANSGDGLTTGLKIGAATEHTEAAWWIPTMHMPIEAASNFTETHQCNFDIGRPHALCVNRKGVRFVNEACSYDEFGNAMVADHVKTGANAPCWMIFDANFRAKYPAGGFLPTMLMPDSQVPQDYWNHYIFRADTIGDLARKIHVPEEALTKTVADMNVYAVTGVDPEFGRGSNAYDQMFGDPTIRPNPCLGPLDKPPYYAMRVNLGDLGTKGGLKADARGRVVDTDGHPIPNLYAAGNNAASPFGNLYPGAGGTLGPAMTFAYVAVKDMAARAANQRKRSS